MKKIALAAAIALASAMPIAHAQWAVIDPTNLIQNTLTAMRTLDQINNQIRQLQNEAQMLINQARNLQGLDFSVLSRLRMTLARTEQLIAEARGLGYELGRLDDVFEQLYPHRYDQNIPGSVMADQARERWSNTLDGLHTAMRMQAQAAELMSHDEAMLGDLVERSQAALGSLQALQVNNQLLALQSRQSIQLQQLQLTQGRAISLELARQAAAIERGREVSRRFLGNGTPYTPHTARFYER